MVCYAVHQYFSETGIWSRSMVKAKRFTFPMPIYIITSLWITEKNFERFQLYKASCQPFMVSKNTSYDVNIFNNLPCIFTSHMNERGSAWSSIKNCALLGCYTARTVILTTTSCVIVQKSTVLICFVAEAWNHT